MAEVVRARPIEIAPSVRALLAAFHEDTHRKLALAPIDSSPIFHAADGRLGRVDDDGWISDLDADLDSGDGISAPTGVHDEQTP
ncbi:hypothetical protein ACQP0C_14250 [Nocardia sp. CA-129566]|uniref:hypothetical protein n=1 Tax=Nocardia sp. CA-129566 TaxID=3239976 RepID=UPI003D9793EF